MMHAAILRDSIADGGLDDQQRAPDQDEELRVPRLVVFPALHWMR
jgi:hypothetical protein